VRPWWVFWATVVLGAVLWIAVPLLAGRDAFRSFLGQPLGLAVLLGPLAAAGINLIVFRDTHEAVCRVEAARHRSLRAVVGRGYSARTFAATGVVLLAVAVVILAAALPGRP
jgi:hypothetical protein